MNFQRDTTHLHQSCLGIQMSDNIALVDLNLSLCYYKRMSVAWKCCTAELRQFASISRLSDRMSNVPTAFLLDHIRETQHVSIWWSRRGGDVAIPEGLRNLLADKSYLHQQVINKQDNWSMTGWKMNAKISDNIAKNNNRKILIIWNNINRIEK